MHIDRVFFLQLSISIESKSQLVSRMHSCSTFPPTVFTHNRLIHREREPWNKIHYAVERAFSAWLGLCGGLLRTEISIHSVRTKELCHKAGNNILSLSGIQWTDRFLSFLRVLKSSRTYIPNPFEKT